MIKIYVKLERVNEIRRIISMNQIYVNIEKIY